MPGRFYLTRPVSALADKIGAVADVETPPRLNIAPGEDILVCTPARRLVLMRWGLIPVGRVNARGRPVMETIVNARSETVFDKSAFDGVGRAVVPADGWYEWTGATGRKQVWRIRRRDGDPIFFAAITDIWRAPGGRSVAQVATVTCAPSRDVKDIHHRMGVILEPDAVGSWLSGTDRDAAALAVPFRDGGLVVEAMDDVDLRGS